jgi:uncharacterized protein RhaS with RHS repeats
VNAEHYNYFRDYDPSIGRFVESDPVGLLGGINTYNYVGANSLISVDPRGLKGCGSGKYENQTPNLVFASCCDSHDDCYDDCKKRPTKAECDQGFCSCVYRRCAAIGNVAACASFAEGYCAAVRHSDTADDAFRDSRKKCDGKQACAASPSKG